MSGAQRSTVLVPRKKPRYRRPASTTLKCPTDGAPMFRYRNPDSTQWFAECSACGLVKACEVPM